MSRQLVYRLSSLGVAALLFLGLGWRLLHLYSGREVDYSEFREPTRAFLKAAQALDSAALVRLSASAEAVAWGLAQGRRDTALLLRLQDAEPTSARRADGETLVLYTIPHGGSCPTAPLAISFRGSSPELRVDHVSVECIGGR